MRSPRAPSPHRPVTPACQRRPLPRLAGADHAGTNCPIAL